MHRSNVGCNLFRHMAYVDKTLSPINKRLTNRPLHYQHDEEHVRRKIILEKL